MVKNLLANSRDESSIPGLGRSCGARNSNPLQYSFLENPMQEPGGLQLMGLQKNWTRLSDQTTKKG